MDDPKAREAARKSLSGREARLIDLRKKRVKRSCLLRVPPSCKVYTPPSLADAMVATLGNEEGDSWLEPSIGTGALLSALRDQGVSRDQIIGVDLDPKSQELDSLARVKRGVEFLAWSLAVQERFDKIICNPPYIAIERLQSRVRRSACRIETLGGVRVSAAGNLWYAFLCAAINLLRDNGSLCFVLPAAWDFANYARPLREKIIAAFDRVEVYRCGEPLFHAAEIQDGAVILVARRKRTNSPASHPSNAVPLWRRNFSRGSDLIRALRLAHSVTRPPGLSPTDTTSIHLADRSSRISVRLGDLVTIEIGGVTGDASYFLLTESERAEWGLPSTALRPVVSKAKHLQCSHMTFRHWRELVDADERVWLFRPSSAAINHSAVRAYLRHGRSGGCDLASHKISNRAAWHQTPLPKGIDAFISGMSQLGPWFTFRAMPRLTASNTLYVARFSNAGGQSWAAVALALLSSYVRDQLPIVGRVYADGLVKFEPGDLRELRLHLPVAKRPAMSLYRQAVNKMLSGELRSAMAIADEYCCERT